MQLTQTVKTNLGQRMDDNMIPLINVVFLMLIFFMIAGQIEKADPINVLPPSSINNTQQVEKPDIVIFLQPSLLKKQQVFVNNTLLPITELVTYLHSRERLTSVATSKQALMKQRGNAQLSKLSVQIKADAKVKVTAMTPIFLQLKQVGIKKVQLTTQLGQRTSKRSR